MINLLSGKLLDWYRQEHRKLPWRNTKDPYQIWISEVILQQTRVEQGLPYYQAFIKNFPDVKTLASAPLQQVLKLWQGLGYYSRARNLHHAARQVVNDYHGKFPSGFEELLSLKGVGHYTAAAIASIAFNKPYAVADGNVMRVLSRLFAASLPVNSTAGIKFFREKAQDILDKEKPSLHNQAMMELGALVCKPVNPLCDDCPLRNDCKAFQTGTVSRYPVKEKKTAPAVISRHYLIIANGGMMMLKQRTDKGIWKGLYEFPSLEKKGKAVWREAELKRFLRQSGVSDFVIKKQKEEIKHLLSHRIIHATFSVVKAAHISAGKAQSEGFTLIRKRDLKKFPVHRLMEKIMSKAGLEKT